MYRFMYIILGYIAGFLGIALGFFIHFAILSNQTSFGVPFFTPYIPYTDLSKNENLYIQINKIYSIIFDIQIGIRNIKL